jgi:hypothetical protein
MDNNRPGKKILNSDKKEIQDLLNSVLKDHILQQSIAKNNRIKSVQSLVSIISEYLGSFFIIGYDVSGQPVNLIHATNQKDADALSAAINRFIFQSMKGPDKSEED